MCRSANIIYVDINAQYINFGKIRHYSMGLNTLLLWLKNWAHFLGICSSVNTLGPRQNGRHFLDIFKWIFMNASVWIPIKFSLQFVPKGPVDNIPSLIQIMSWRRPGNEPLSEPMIVILSTRPQWVNYQATDYCIIKSNKIVGSHTFISHYEWKLCTHCDIYMFSANVYHYIYTYIYLINTFLLNWSVRDFSVYSLFFSIYRGQQM